jgi:small subunit ribosomal protein S5
MGRRDRDRRDREELDERVLDITRVAKVIKGGRRFAFRTVVVVGDNRGRVGVGVGKARAVPDSIRKGADRARRNMVQIPMVDSTIPHGIEWKYGGAVVMLRPAAPGTGVIAGGAVRAVVEAAGIRDILSKSKGSANMLNVARAAWYGLQELRDIYELAEDRGKSPKEILPFWMRQPAEQQSEGE